MESNPRTAELKRMYDYVRKVCCYTGCKKYEGVPIDDKWKTFDGFLKDNWFRYYRAKIKWKGYKRVVVRKDRQADPLINNNLR